MIKLETHAHVKGGSHCAHVRAKVMVKEFFEAGYKAITLTTHYCKSCYDAYPGKTHKRKIKYYLSLRDKLKRAAKKYGIKVFLGAEITAKTPMNTFAEFMLVGFDDAFLYDNPPLFNLTQKELFELANQNGIFMYQTHPMRKGIMTGDPRYIHGAEAFNGHANHNNCNNFANDFCDVYNLKKMSGTDYHDPRQPITAGVYIPENIENQRQLAEYYFNNQCELIKDNQTYLEEYALRHYGKK